MSSRMHHQPNTDLALIADGRLGFSVARRHRIELCQVGWLFKMWEIKLTVVGPEGSR
jgi:hypothetical protein